MYLLKKFMAITCKRLLDEWVLVKHWIVLLEYQNHLTFCMIPIFFFIKTICRFFSLELLFQHCFVAIFQRDFNAAFSNFKHEPYITYPILLHGQSQDCVHHLFHNALHLLGGVHHDALIQSPLSQNTLLHRAAIHWDHGESETSSAM